MFSLTDGYRRIGTTLRYDMIAGGQFFLCCPLISDQLLVRARTGEVIVPLNEDEWYDPKV